MPVVVRAIRVVKKIFVNASGHICIYRTGRLNMKKKNGGFYGNGGDIGSRGDDALNADKVRRTVDSYSGMSEDALLEELFAEAATARRRGELDDKKLDLFYNSVRSSLSPAQLRKLDVLMRALKS